MWNYLKAFSYIPYLLLYETEDVSSLMSSSKRGKFFMAISNKFLYLFLLSVSSCFPAAFCIHKRTNQTSISKIKCWKQILLTQSKYVPTEHSTAALKFKQINKNYQNLEHPKTNTKKSNMKNCNLGHYGINFMEQIIDYESYNLNILS